MKRYGWTIVAGLAAAWSVNAQDPRDAVEGLELQLATYPNGHIRTLLTADKTYAGKGGSVRAEGVKVRYFEEDGKTVTAVIEVENCAYDQDAEVVVSKDGKVRVERGGVRVTGVGFELRTQDEHVRITRDVRVVFRREAVMKGRSD